MRVVRRARVESDAVKKEGRGENPAGVAQAGSVFMNPAKTAAMMMKERNRFTVLIASICGQGQRRRCNSIQFCPRLVHFVSGPSDVQT